MRYTGSTIPKSTPNYSKQRHHELNFKRKEKSLCCWLQLYHFYPRRTKPNLPCLALIAFSHTSPAGAQRHWVSQSGAVIRMTSGCRRRRTRISSTCEPVPSSTDMFFCILNPGNKLPTTAPPRQVSAEVRRTRQHSPPAPRTPPVRQTDRQTAIWGNIG